MAITQDDFNKIWASTSSVPEYTFSDADYQDGWEFVGNLPPTRAMWDTLQRRNDQKTKYLKDNGSMCFDSVSDMVASNLESGQTVITKGYYSVNDGGSALYTIRAKDVADVDDGGSIIFLNNGKVAELITYGTVNVKQFGAYGDNTHDDSVAIQNAIDTGKPVCIHDGTYKTTQTIDLSNKEHIDYDWTNSVINYTGNDCAVLLQTSRYMTLQLGQVWAYSGDAIKLVSASNTDYVQYINIDFDYLRGNTTNGACIRGEISGTGWVNEIRINKGRFVTGKYGCVIHRASDATESIDNWNFANVGFEGIDIGNYFTNENTAKPIRNISYYGCRCEETNTAFIKSEGLCTRIKYYGGSSINLSWLDFDSDADRWSFYTNADTYPYVSVYQGQLFYEGESATLWGGKDFQSGADLDDVVTPGNYRAYTDAIAATIQNSPTSEIFTLKVYAINSYPVNAASLAYTRLVQEITDKKNKVYRRSSYGGSSWSVWEKVITGGDNNTNPIEAKFNNIDSTIAESKTGNVLIWRDKNNVQIGAISKVMSTNGDKSRWYDNSYGQTAYVALGFLSGTYEKQFHPGSDGDMSLGNSYYHWKQLYASSSTISTSDERVKDNIESIPNEVLDTWGEVGWYQYQFKDSIAEKGESRARLHTGAIAQRIESVFDAHGLDANKYGLLCYDEWKAEPAERDEEGNIVQPARPAGNRYSLRYEEALCMEAAYQRRRADRLEARIEALERAINHE